MTASNSSVAIFRKRLLAYSETFIADQGQHLPGFTPVYCGFQRDASGIELIRDSRRLLLDDYARFPQWAKLRLRSGFGCDADWLAAIRAASPALLHAHFLSDGIDAIRLGEQLMLPVLTTVHGHDITKAEKTSPLRKGKRFFFERVDRVIAVSRFIAAAALAQGCPEEKLVQHYIGIDLERFTQEKNESAHPSLLFVGRLVEKKGCTYLLQAMERLRDRVPGLQLTIVGDGELRGSLQQEAEARALDVVFAGTETAAQIRTRLASSWLFVAPSITAEDGDAEGLGMVFLEAQALRTPVVSFRSGGVVEAVADEVTGLLCAEKDVDALAENMLCLLENASLRHNMGLQGRERVETRFDLRRQCASLESIYHEVC